jgi:uncharacterized repeat protein (TIGR01451 family)
MNEKGNSRENRRRDWVIILIILLLGFLCVIIAGQWAIRFSPGWRLDTSMESNLNPNSDFLTNRPVSYIEPLDPAILTQPVWVNVFLTPGTLFDTRTPAPTSSSGNTPVATKTGAPTQAAATSTAITLTLPVATKTSVYIPPTSTPKPVTAVPPSADLQATITDGVTTYMAGSVVNYTIVVSNNGTGNITGAVVSDIKPTQVTTWSWTCTQFNGASGCNGTSGSANFSDTVNLPSGASITYVVTANIAISATGNLTNTASVAVPVGATDPNTGNNSATDTDTVFIPSADLQITKSDGVTTYAGGNVLTYTITVSNAGPNAVTGATVSDTRPTQIANWSWTCVNNSGASGCDAAALGTANFNDVVNLPSGANIVYTVTANIIASPIGALSNTATVNVPVGYTDPNALNNSATDTDTLFVPISADLQIAKDDGSLTYTSYTGSDTVTYTIVVTNNSPSNVTGAIISDTKPTQVSTWGWCVAPCTPVTASNTNLTATINLTAGTSITYTVRANITYGATGNLDNTASVSVPVGYTDPIPGNDSATDSDTLFVPSVDLAVTKTDGVATYISGSQTIYTVTISNNGPDAVVGAALTDNIPSQITNWSWACTSQLNGANGCTAAPNINTNFSDTVNLPNGASITYTVIADISNTATGPGPLNNTASVSVPAVYNDPISANDTALDSDTYAQSADLLITKTDGAGVTTYNAGGSVTYTITVSNPSGPDNVTNATVADTFPSQVASATWTCSGASGGTCTASGSGDISDNTVDLPVGASVTYIVNATISSAATGPLVNTAVVTAPVGVTDPVSGNNSATDTDTPIFSVDLGITKSDGVTTYTPGSFVTYTIVVTNPSGPADATGAIVTDTFPSGVTATWTCASAGGATCTASGSGNISDTVNIPVGNSVTYTVTANIASSRTGSLDNTATVTAASGYTDIASGNNFATDSDTQNSIADLSITKTDNSTHYVAGATKIYFITVSNAGPSNVTGATVSDNLPPQITSWDWECNTVTNASGCDPVTGSTTNFTDTVNIQSGGSITYRVVAIVGGPSGDLVNTASVSSAIDSNTGNNSATDTDTLFTSSGTSNGGNIGLTQDSQIDVLPSGGSLILTLSSTITIGAHSGPDLIYYEQDLGGYIAMDWIILEVSDGSNWYTIFNWRDGNPNPGTNVNVVTTPANTVDCSTEADNCNIVGTFPLADYLGNGLRSGITIDLDSFGIPPGTVIQYIRITAPAGDMPPDGAGIDGIYVIP